MNTESAINKLITVALAETGYHEQPENINKYADEAFVPQVFGWDLQGQPWCCVYVMWCFVKAFGLDKTYNLTYTYPSCSAAACKKWADYYKANGAFFSEPQKGDQVFFFVGGDINHTGIVTEVTDRDFCTIEGNTSDGVYPRSYTRADRSVAGFGRPNWSVLQENDTPPAPETELPETGSEYYYFYMKLFPGDGMPSTNGWESVKALQALLNLNDASPQLDVDGQFGPLTARAVKAFQAERGLEDSGKINEQDWKELIKVRVKI